MNQQSAKLELMGRKTQLMANVDSLTAKIVKLTGDLDRSRVSKATDIEDARKQHIGEETDRIELEFHDKILDLKKKNQELEAEFYSQTVDESDEEVAEIRQKTILLNQLANRLNKLHQALYDVSTPYFINLAQNNNTFSNKRYHKELKKIDVYSNHIYKLADTQVLPVIFCDKISPFVTANVAPYITGVILAPIAVFLFPIYLYKAYKRAKSLHNFSTKYFIMMNTAYKLQDAQSMELETLLESVIQTKKDTVADHLEEVKKQLEDVETKKAELIKNIEFDPIQMEKALEQAIVTMEEELFTLREQLEYNRKALMEVEAKLSTIQQNQLALDKDERDPYINPQNLNRRVEFPFRYLYKYDEHKNTFAALKSGLYIYNERSTAEDLVRSIVFQMRNYMVFSTLRIYILDLLMGMYISDMVLTNRLDVKVDSQRSDIVVDSLNSDMEARVETLHDIMTRRAISVKQIASDLSQYNRVQEAAGSASLSFELAFYFVENQVNLSEKLIQLLKVGESLGVLVFLFIQRDILTIDTVKVFEKYIPTFIEVTASGASETPPRTFREHLEREVKSKQRTR